MAWFIRMGNRVRGAVAAALFLPLACAVAEDPEPAHDGAARGGEPAGGMPASSGNPGIAGGGSAGAWRGGSPLAGASHNTGAAGADTSLSGNGGGGRSSSGGDSSAGKAVTSGAGGAFASAGALASGSGGSISAGRSSSGGSPAGASAGGFTAGAASGGKPSGGAGTAGTMSAAGAGSGGCTSGCLLHRYSFAGTGNVVEDSIGDADATAVNTTLQSGAVQLAGGTSDQYVRIPPATLSGLTSATLEVWLTWSGGSAWQRIFDIGSNNGSTAGAQGPAGTSYLFLTPKAYNSTGKLRAAYSLNGPNMETRVEGAAALAAGTVTHVAVVIDDATNKLLLYLDGSPAGSSALASSLSSVSVQNFWLGRSQFQVDPELGGSIHEFRIYRAALSAAEVRASFMAGRDALPGP